MTSESETRTAKWLPTLVSIVSFLFISVSAVAAISGQFARMDERLISVTEQAARNKAQIQSLEAESKENSARFATILEKLNNLEKTLAKYDGN